MKKLKINEDIFIGAILGSSITSVVFALYFMFRFLILT